MSDEERVNPQARTKLTYDDFLLLPDDGQRHELIDGEHYVTPSPVPRHQVVAGNLYYLIRHHLETHPAGHVYFAPLDVVFSNYDVVEPDLLFVSNARGNVVTQQHVRGAPDLVIEILSPGTRRRDETLKRDLYQRFDVSEYWVVDPVADIVHVYRGLAAREKLSAAADDHLTSPLLPGLSLALVDVFRE